MKSKKLGSAILLPAESKRGKNNNNMVKMAKMWFSGHVLAEKVNASTKFATFGNGPTFYMTIRIHPCMSLLNSIFCQLKCLGKHSEDSHLNITEFTVCIK